MASGSPWIEVGDELGEARAVGSGGEVQSFAIGSPLLLFVFEPECGHCRDIAPRWREWAESTMPKVRIVAATTATPEEGRSFLSTFGWHPEVWTVDSGVGPEGRRPLATRTPWLFLLDGNGVVQAEEHGGRIEELAADWSEFLELGTLPP